jgi:hypothetical protein
MEEPYVEGLATRDGPESCACSGNGVGEALAGVRAGWAIEPREHTCLGVPTCSESAEGDVSGSVRRELSGDPARSENLCMCGTFMCENREVLRLPVAVIGRRAAWGRLRPYA